MDATPMPYQSNAHFQSDEMVQFGEPVNILAVEDDLFALRFLEVQISDLGHHMISASNGQEALDILTHSKMGEIDVVLMDREMPIMDGLTAIKHMKDDPVLRHIPVIMVTGADTIEELREGLDAGVFYYLTKPVNETMLRSVLSAAIREAEQTKTLSEELGKHKSSFDLIDTCRFEFKTLSQAESLAAFLANCFPDPERVLPGLAELLINAVEHGNLEIGYDKKTSLIEEGTWRAEVERRTKLPEYKDRSVIATIAHKTNGTYVVIEDQGSGFDFRPYMEIDPARAGDNHGRGIAQAKTMSFDDLKYNKDGRQVIAFVGNGERLEW
jgi:two-component system, cell cycle response regulator